MKCAAILFFQFFFSLYKNLKKRNISYFLVLDESCSREKCPAGRIGRHGVVVDKFRVRWGQVVVLCRQRVESHGKEGIGDGEVENLTG